MQHRADPPPLPGQAAQVPAPAIAALIGAGHEDLRVAAAEWRAAADIEVAYPLNRDPDVRLFRVLDQRAKDALATVKLAMQGEGVGQVDLVPYWHFPCPVPPGVTRVRFIDGEGWTWDVLRDNW